MDQCPVGKKTCPQIKQIQLLFKRSVFFHFPSFVLGQFFSLVVALLFLLWKEF